MPIEERRERYYSLNRGAGSVTALKGAGKLVKGMDSRTATEDATRGEGWYET